MTLHKPNIDVTFKTLATSFNARNANKNVILIIKDDTVKTFTKKVYTRLTDVTDSTNYTAANFQAIKDCFVSNIRQCTVIRMDATDGVIADALAIVGGLEAGYVGILSSVATDQQAVAAWIKTQEEAKKSFKGIVYSPTTPPDSREVLNFTNTQVTFKDVSRGQADAWQFIPSLLGYIAGRDTDEGATYLVMENLESVVEPTDLDTAINSGQLILFNDSGVVRIVLGINSKTTLATDEIEDMKLIEVSEAMDIIRDDITNTFKNYYIGKYKNTNNNREIFVSAIKDYFASLAGQEILSSDFNNTVQQDVDAMRQYLFSQGIDAQDMKDSEVKRQKFGRNVFIKGNIEIAEAMTDLTFTNVMN